MLFQDEGSQPEEVASNVTLQLHLLAFISMVTIFYLFIYSSSVLENNLVYYSHSQLFA